jgi:hypothetical protein
MSASSSFVPLSPEQRLSLVKEFSQSVKKLQEQNAKKLQLARKRRKLQVSKSPKLVGLKKMFKSPKASLVKRRRVLKAPKGAVVVSAVVARPLSNESHRVYKASVARVAKKSPSKSVGLKKVRKVKKSVKSPKLVGLKKRSVKSPKLVGLKKMFKSPKASPVKKSSSSLQLVGLKKMFKSPKASPVKKRTLKVSKVAPVKKARKPTKYNDFVKKHFHDAKLQGLTPQEKMARIASAYNNCNQWL